eukprot:GHVU01131780.1.p1 GENE.GHVU01131780.1~~GHVU01131780.1.p1  ORF type:complete len:436 (-),score=21.97 GHVU01131780.1:1228-2535(-)
MDEIMDAIIEAPDSHLEQEASSNPLSSLFHLILIPLLLFSADISNYPRARIAKPPFSRPRMVWLTHLEHLRSEARGCFESHYRMPLDDFLQLHTYLESQLQLRDDMARVSCGQAAIAPVITLHCVVRWLAGGAMEDVRLVAGLSKSSFYRCLHAGMRAIVACPQLAFHFPESADDIESAATAFRALSENDVVRGCVAAVDGWLCETTAPQSWEAVNQTNYFSGHYHCYGVSVIAAADARCRFVYFCVAQPGAANDVRSYQSTDLHQLVETLPPGRFVAGDNGFVCTNKMLTPFSGPQGNYPWQDSFNFHLSQLRIRVEQAFGFMTTKWGILRSPLRVNLCHLGLVLLTIARLHNYVITQRESAVTDGDIDPLNHGSSRQSFRRGYLPTTGGVAPSAGSTMRQVMVEDLQRRGILRPARNTRRNDRQRQQETTREA